MDYMSKEQSTELLAFLKQFNTDIIERVMSLREMVWDQYPQANELIYDNYNALAFGWSPTDKVSHVFCSIAVGRTSNNVHFGFYRGDELSDPDKILLGNGKQYRYILVNDINDFPSTYINHLIKEAYQNSLKKVKEPNQFHQGLTLVKSISEKKRKRVIKPGSKINK
jgi:hypothetical protein